MQIPFFEGRTDVQKEGAGALSVLCLVRCARRWALQQQQAVWNGRHLLRRQHLRAH